MKSKLKPTSKELFYDNFSDCWESKINNKETQKRLRIVYGKLLEKNDIKGKKFLEIGCGLGYFSKEAFKLGARVTGVDIGPKLIKISKKKTPNASFIVADASSLPFKNETFDVVLSTEVIEHINKQVIVIKEMFRVLKKGGVLIITTPNRLYKPLFDFLGLAKIRPYRGNEKWYYPWTLKKILAKYGDIKKEVYFNFFYPNKILNNFERFYLLKYLMVNQGYRIEK